MTVFTRTECDGCGAADCSCIQGYARNGQGQCVYWGDCPVEGKLKTEVLFRLSFFSRTFIDDEKNYIYIYIFFLLFLSLFILR